VPYTASSGTVSCFLLRCLLLPLAELLFGFYMHLILPLAEQLNVVCFVCDITPLAEQLGVFCYTCPNLLLAQWLSVFLSTVWYS
jgi:hypothetical protein